MAATLDPGTGLMISRVDYASGDVLDLPRGCALSLTFAFLPDFAPDFAQNQYAAYRQHFFKTTLGFAGIREYPPDRQRGADSDSGVIFREVGAAATGIGIAGTRAMGFTPVTISTYVIKIMPKMLTQRFLDDMVEIV